MMMIMMDTDYADDQALLANISALAECFLHNQGQKVRGIGFYENSDKTEFIYFKHNGITSTSEGQTSEISRLSGNISFTENNDK